MEVGGHVGAHDKEKLPIRLLGDKLLEGVGSEGLTAPADLDAARLHTIGARHGRLDHGQSVGGRTDRPPALLPRSVGHHQEDPVEIERVADIDRSHEMTGVDRVERPSENAQPFDNPVFGDETILRSRDVGSTLVLRQ